jgi:hypothetical protein
MKLGRVCMCSKDWMGNRVRVLLRRSKFRLRTCLLEDLLIKILTWTMKMIRKMMSRTKKKIGEGT